uniref:Uncharacterized protein n=1 Tax=Heterorhabditis bacteriophora TaxID=37862 RepID=A0A1I7WNP1_HETBA
MRSLDYNLFSCWCWRPSITDAIVLSHPYDIQYCTGW